MTTTLLDAVTRLETALDSLGRALTTGEPSAVLAAEEPIASAVTALASFRRHESDIPGLPQAIASVRAAARRCQALGETANQFSRAVLGDAAYGPRGFQVVAAAPRRVTSVT